MSLLFTNFNAFFTGFDSDTEQDNSIDDVDVARFTTVVNNSVRVKVPKNGIGQLAESIKDKKMVRYCFQLFGPLNTIDTLVNNLL